jgi:hypothetical protein
VLAYLIGAVVAGAWWHREQWLGTFARV